VSERVLLGPLSTESRYLSSAIVTAVSKPSTNHFTATYPLVHNLYLLRFILLIIIKNIVVVIGRVDKWISLHIEAFTLCLLPSLSAWEVILSAVDNLPTIYQQGDSMRINK